MTEPLGARLGTSLIPGPHGEPSSDYPRATPNSRTPQLQHRGCGTPNAIPTTHAATAAPRSSWHSKDALTPEPSLSSAGASTRASDRMRSHGLDHVAGADKADAWLASCKIKTTCRGWRPVP